MAFAPPPPPRNAGSRDRGEDAVAGSSVHAAASLHFLHPCFLPLPWKQQLMRAARKRDRDGREYPRPSSRHAAVRTKASQSLRQSRKKRICRIVARNERRDWLVEERFPLEETRAAELPSWDCRGVRPCRGEGCCQRRPGAEGKHREDIFRYTCRNRLLHSYNFISHPHSKDQDVILPFHPCSGAFD